MPFWDMATLGSMAWPFLSPNEPDPSAGAARPDLPRVGRPRRDRTKVKAGRKAARARR